jgi:hypothetical protein
LAAQVKDDLRYLHATWTQHTIDDNFLRRDSATLRRLLTDGGGILGAYRRELGLKGEIRVEALDLMAHLRGLNQGLIQFASAGGARHGGMEVRGTLMYLDVMPPELVKQRYQHGIQMKSMSLQQYLDSPCLLIRGTVVRRRDLIQYVANKKGGVHYDPKRNASAKAFLALDSLSGRVRIADKEAMYFELLAIGQTLVASPDVVPLLTESAPR